jgi:hypothetical protein
VPARPFGANKNHLSSVAMGVDGPRGLVDAYRLTTRCESADLDGCLAQFMGFSVHGLRNNWYGSTKISYCHGRRRE